MLQNNLFFVQLKFCQTDELFLHMPERPRHTAVVSSPPAWILDIDELPDIAGTGSQPYQVLDPFLNNQGAHGHSWGRFGFR